MATSGGARGNVQAAVAAQHHLIIVHEVTNIGNDRSQLSTMAKQAQDATGVCELTATAAMSRPQDGCGRDVISSTFILRTCANDDDRSCARRSSRVRDSVGSCLGPSPLAPLYACKLRVALDSSLRRVDRRGSLQARVQRFVQAPEAEQSRGRSGLKFSSAFLHSLLCSRTTRIAPHGSENLSGAFDSSARPI
jgi:hypothetical protein